MEAGGWVTGKRWGEGRATGGSGDRAPAGPPCVPVPSFPMSLAWCSLWPSLLLPLLMDCAPGGPSHLVLPSIFWALLPLQAPSPAGNQAAEVREADTQQRVPGAVWDDPTPEDCHHSATKQRPQGDLGLSSIHPAHCLQPELFLHGLLSAGGIPPTPPHTWSCQACGVALLSWGVICTNRGQPPSCD